MTTKICLTQSCRVSDCAHYWIKSVLRHIQAAILFTFKALTELFLFHSCQQPSKTEAPLLPPIITKKTLESIDPSYSVSDERNTPPLSPRKRKNKSLLALGLPRTRSVGEFLLFFQLKTMG